MNDLDKLLKTVEAPEPSDTLKARILREAKSARTQSSTPIAANDNRWKKWSAIAATILILGVLGVTTFTPTNDISEEELWAETAEEIGYDDLYAWVNDEDYTEGQDQSHLETDSVPI